MRLHPESNTTRPKSRKSLVQWIQKLYSTYHILKALHKGVIIKLVI